MSSAFEMLNRRTVRSTPNPLDKSTIVSIFPERVEEFKATIMPGNFVIEPGSYDKPSLLVVEPSSWWKELDQNQPLLEIQVSSILIADSIIKDWCNGLFECNMSTAGPGLFFVPGNKSVADIKKDHKDMLDSVAVRQKNWYISLIRAADNLWASTNGNPRSISRHMKLAAQELQMKDKPWLKDFTTLELKNCPACGVLRNDAFPMCANCKTIIDKAAYEKLGLKVAS
jgi:hypothetical protein